MRDRYTVRVGDDGETKSTHHTLTDARTAAYRLSLTNWSGQAQILDSETGAREIWQEGAQPPVQSSIDR